MLKLPILMGIIAIDKINQVWYTFIVAVRESRQDHMTRKRRKTPPSESPWKAAMEHSTAAARAPRSVREGGSEQVPESLEDQVRDIKLRLLKMELRASGNMRREGGGAMPSASPAPAEVKGPPHVLEEAAYDGLLHLHARWDLSGNKIAAMLNLPATTVNHWFRSGCIPVGKPPFKPDGQAVFHLIAIHWNLEAMFEGSPESQLAWLNTPHPDFLASPRSVLSKDIEGLIRVRRYLDFVRERGA